MINPILKVDMYNYSHWYSVPANNDIQVSHMYNRSKPMILFGLNSIIKRITKTKITRRMIRDAKRKLESTGLPFPEQLWLNVVEQCDGYLPLKIQQLPEGTWVPKGTPFCQVRNTVKGYGEIVGHIEAQLMKAYFPSGVATEAAQYYERQQKLGLSPFRYHSFGYRGHRSEEDAELAAKAWGLFFEGSDDSHALELNRSVKSIPALAHRVVQQWDNEWDCYVNFVNQAIANKWPIISMVIDTYDANGFIDKYLLRIASYAAKNKIKIVFRPDSGNILVQVIKIFTQLKEYGLHEMMGVIIGEGMNFKKTITFDKFFLKNNIPLTFIVYGIGGGLYNHIDRDYLGWAYKVSFAQGMPRMKFSNNPIKQSIPGIIGVVRKNQNLIVYPESMITNNLTNELITVYEYTQNKKPVSNSFPDKSIISNAKTTMRTKELHTQQTILLHKDIENTISIYKQKYIGN